MRRAHFGSPERFEIDIRWTQDRQPRELLPAHGGWSTGELKLTIANQTLTRHEHRGNRESVQWYLMPIFEWLVENWVELFHEQNYDWRDNSAAPAATATFAAMRKSIAEEDDAGRAEYRKVQAWWRRHALRAADSSALYPDVYFRRLGNDIEISWTSRQPIYAPDGFRFELTPGVVTLPVSDVVLPMWEALDWFIRSHPASHSSDIEAIRAIARKRDRLNQLPTQEMEAGFLPSEIIELIETAKRKLGLTGNSTRIPSAPAIDLFDTPAFMFGGVEPSFSASDIEALLGFLASRCDGSDSRDLSQLVDTAVGAPIGVPFEEGYVLAQDFLEAMELPKDDPFVDIEAILHRLNVEIKELSLETASVRGVAVAGDRLSPAILVNTRNQFNLTDPGRRFTLAHELFHILYDRARARCVTHVSGPWALPGIEKRANAFAAMLLMPSHLARKAARTADAAKIAAAARSMRVGKSALIDHLYNLDLIDGSERDRLKDEISAVRYDDE